MLARCDMRVSASVAPKPSASESTAVPRPTSNERSSALCHTGDCRNVPNHLKLNSFGGNAMKSLRVNAYGMTDRTGATSTIRTTMV